MTSTWIRERMAIYLVDCGWVYDEIVDRWELPGYDPVFIGVGATELAFKCQRLTERRTP